MDLQILFTMLPREIGDSIADPLCLVSDDDEPPTTMPCTTSEAASSSAHARAMTDATSSSATGVEVDDFGLPCVFSKRGPDGQPIRCLDVLSSQEEAQESVVDDAASCKDVRFDPTAMRVFASCKLCVCTH